MPGPQQTISRADAERAILRSGYLIESRLERLLAGQGYYIEANDAYLDPLTGKSREIDLYALTARQVTNRLDFVFNVLLIECINNPQPFVLLTKRPQIGFLFHEDLRVAGLPVKLVTGNRHRRWEPIQEALKLGKFHHYCAKRVATQFCSFTRKPNQDWMAQHEGPHFDALQKLCDAVSYVQDRQFKGWQFGSDETINLEFYYPVLVVQGELLEGRPSAKGITLSPARHVPFRRTAIRGSNAETYQIDIVTERHFPRLVHLLNDELETIVRRIKARKKRFLKSVDRIVAKGRRLRSPDTIRKALENP
jgi:hypothetical protein